MCIAGCESKSNRYISEKTKIERQANGSCLLASVRTSSKTPGNGFRNGSFPLGSL